MVSSGMKDGDENDLFNPDLAAEVLSAYRQSDEAKSVYDLTGKEFDDFPPLTSGQNAFAQSIALMMHTMASLDPGDSHGSAYLELLNESTEKIRKQIKETVGAFLLGCGLDEKGKPYDDVDKQNKAREVFKQKRAEYQRLVKNEGKIIGRKILDDIREKNGISDRLPSEITGEDVTLERLIADNPEAVKAHAGEIEEMRTITKLALIEAAERTEAWYALEAGVDRVLSDPEVDASTKRLLHDSVMTCSEDIDILLERTLDRKIAAFYMARYILTGAEVDEIAREKIAKITLAEPVTLPYYLKLSEIPGFVLPVEKEDIVIPDTVPFKEAMVSGEKVRKYLYTHPWQFDCQCLISISTETEELTDMMSLAWAVSKWIDGFTMREEFRQLPKSDIAQLFEVYLNADLLCRIGFTIAEVVIENKDKTVEEATKALRDVLPTICYSTLERQTREVMKQIFEERGNAFVPQQEA